MADAYKQLYQGFLTSAGATLYTVPASTRTILRNIVIASVSGAATSAALYHNGSALTNVILPPVNILVSGWAEWDGTKLMASGDTLFGKAGIQNALVATVYGDEVT